MYCKIVKSLIATVLVTYSEGDALLIKRGKSEGKKEDVDGILSSTEKHLPQSLLEMDIEMQSNASSNADDDHNGGDWQNEFVDVDEDLNLPAQENFDGHSLGGGTDYNYFGSVGRSDEVEDHSPPRLQQRDSLTGLLI